MAKIENFIASMEMPSGMKPSGNNTFPLVQAHDILVGDDDLRLDRALDGLASVGYVDDNISFALSYANSIVDVAELPTENINKKVIYRLAHPAAEVYVTVTNMLFTVGTLKEFISFFFNFNVDCTVDVQIVETLPDSLELSVIENGGTLNVYIVRSTGVAYFDKGQGTMTVGKYLFQLDSANKGWVTDINAESGGVCCIDYTTYTYHVYKEGVWVEFAYVEGIKEIKTIDGSKILFFVGSQEEYLALSAEERENLFAIITNDATQEEMIEAIEGILNGELVAKKAECDADGNNIADTYVKKKVVYKHDFPHATVVGVAGSDTAAFCIGELPDGKTVDDIISIGLSADLEVSISSNSSMLTRPLFCSASRFLDTVTIHGELPKEQTSFHLNTTTTQQTAVGLFVDYGEMLIPVWLTVTIYSQGGKLYAEFSNISYGIVNEHAVVIDGLDASKFATGLFRLFYITCVFA